MTADIDALFAEGVYVCITIYKPRNFTVYRVPSTPFLADKLPFYYVITIESGDAAWVRKKLARIEITDS